MAENQNNNRYGIFRFIWIFATIIITGYLYRLYKPYFAIPGHLRHFDAGLHLLPEICFALHHT